MSVVVGKEAAERRRLRVTPEEARNLIYDAVHATLGRAESFISRWNSS